MHEAMRGAISPREADAMSFNELIEVHRTLDAVDADAEAERMRRAQEQGSK